MSLLPTWSTCISSKLVSAYWQTYSKVYVERQKTQNSWLKGSEGCRWRTDPTYLQDCNKATVIKTAWYWQKRTRKQTHKHEVNWPLKREERNTVEQRQSPEQTVQEKLDISLQTDGLDLTPYTKLNSKWIVALNIKCKTIKLKVTVTKKAKWPRVWLWLFRDKGMIHERSNWCEWLH